MIIQPEISSVTIVLVGSLNPRIFTPDWFARQELLSVGEAEAAEVEILHEDISAFRAEWFSLRVEQKRFVAETLHAPHIRLCDLVIRTFRERLPHTPLGLLGINRRVHFDFGSFEVRDRVGSLLAPKDPWGEWGPHVSGGSDLKTHGGLISLTMEQRDIKDRPAKRVRAKIEPSTKVGQGRSGVFMEINDHYEINDPNNPVGADDIILILEHNFEASIRNSDWIINQIMKLKDHK